MTIRISAGPAADPQDRLAAGNAYALVRDELPRLRAAGLAWSKGLGALLAGLIGFGLIKGRTDVGQLSSPYDAVVGLLLLAALLVGAGSAYLLLRAAYGRPSARSVRGGPANATPASALADDHTETIRSATALSWGVGLTLACAGLLCAAVAVTWYGPAKESPRIQVTTPSGPICGQVVRLTGGTLTLKTAGGEVGVDLQSATGLQAVASCPPSGVQ